MMAGLIDALVAAGTDEAVRAVLLRGAGEHFCSGADIVARNAGAAVSGPVPAASSAGCPTQAHRLIPLLLETQVPVVCAVQGWAAGLGFQLALAADVCVAAADATLLGAVRRAGLHARQRRDVDAPAAVGDVRAPRAAPARPAAVAGPRPPSGGAIHRAVPAEALTRRRTRARRPARGAGRRSHSGSRSGCCTRAGAATLDDQLAERGVRDGAVVAERGLPRGPRRVP